MNLKPPAHLTLTMIVSMVFGASSGYCEGVKAFTKPKEDRMLSFVTNGRVAEVLVKEGQTVEKGRVLAKMDDEAERFEVEKLKAKAQEQTHILAASAELEQKQAFLEEVTELKKRESASKWEVKKAQLDVTIANLSLKLAEFTHIQDDRVYRAAQAQLDRMRLISPIDGKVEEIHIKPGESAQGLTDAIRVVKIEPLWIEAPVHLPEALPLKLGQSADVTFVGDTKGVVRGKITHIGAVADYGSYTLTVYVELPAGLNRPAGEEVFVSFPPAAARPTATGPVKTTAIRTQGSRTNNAQKE